MKKPVHLIFAVILLVTCSGCLVAVQEERRGYREHDQRGYDDRDRGYYDGDRRDDRRNYDERRY